MFGRVGFQFLIGRLEIDRQQPNKEGRRRFQFLIGRLEIVWLDFFRKEL